MKGGLSLSKDPILRPVVIDLAVIKILLKIICKTVKVCMLDALLVSYLLFARHTLAHRYLLECEESIIFTI